MSNLAVIPTALAMTHAMQAKQGQALDPWQALRDDQRQTAGERAVLVQRVIRDERLHGVSRRQAIGALLAGIEAGQAVGPLAQAAAALARDGGAPDQATLYRWCKAFEERGLVGLAPAYRGRQRKAGGWEERAIALWNQGQQPAYATVAIWLEQEGFRVNPKALTRFLKALPDEVGGVNSPRRVGRHYYGLNFGKFTPRDAQAVPAGFVYEGDGHCCDVYVAHPNSGNAWRPELTVWLDIHSGACLGWWISESESFHTTLFSLANTLVAHDHVPASIHVDPGPGFENAGMLGELTGFLPRMGIEMITALPGNAKGKGYVEGWFRWFEEREGKKWPTFMQRRTDDAHERLRYKVEKGLLRLPHLEEYKLGIATYVDWFNKKNPVKSFGSSRLAQFERTLERCPVVTPLEDLLRPREVRTVQNWTVRLANRWYRDNALRHFNGKEVLVEYSLTDDQAVTVRDLQGRRVCQARLLRKTPWLEDSRIAEGLRRRLEGQKRRLQERADELEQRAKPMLTMDDIEAVLDTLSPQMEQITRAAPVGVARIEEAADGDFSPFDCL
jgi:putative transposase